LVEKILDQRDYTGSPYRDDVSNYQVLPDGWVKVSTTMTNFGAISGYFLGGGWTY
jgi:hypothetical protein